MMMKLIPAHVTTFGRPTCHIKICQKNVLFVVKNVLFVLKKCSFCSQKMFFLLPKNDLFVLKIIYIKYIQNIHFFSFRQTYFRGKSCLMIKVTVEDKFMHSCQSTQKCFLTLPRVMFRLLSCFIFILEFQPFFKLQTERSYLGNVFKLFVLSVSENS